MGNNNYIKISSGGFIKEIIKNSIYFLLFQARNVVSFFYGLQEVSILCYHSVDGSDWDLSIEPKVLEEQFLFFLKNNYYFATLDEIVSHVSGKITLPKKTIAITFDDGYESVFTNAFPLLVKYNIPATIFVVSKFEEAKKRLGHGLKPLTLTQIQEMKDSGLVNIGDHSSTHVTLSELSNTQLREEIKNIQGLSYFAYPGGSYSKNVMQVVKNEGFTAAFSIKRGLVNKNNDLFLLKRNVVLKSMPLWYFKAITTKANDWYMVIVRLFK